MSRVLNEIDENTLGAFIRRKRLEKKWSQEELAKRMGANDASFVSKIEKGVFKVPVTTLHAVVKALGIDHEFMDETLKINTNRGKTDGTTNN